MSRTSARRALLLQWVPLVAAFPVAVGLGWQVHAHGTPVWLTGTVVVVGWVAWIHLLTPVFQSTGSAEEVVHRCPEPGCDLMVRLTGVDAAESRRWQELCADHTRHGA